MSGVEALWQWTAPVLGPIVDPYGLSLHHPKGLVLGSL